MACQGVVILDAGRFSYIDLPKKPALFPLVETVKMVFCGHVFNLFIQHAR